MVSAVDTARQVAWRKEMQKNTPQHEDQDEAKKKRPSL